MEVNKLNLRMKVNNVLENEEKQYVFENRYKKAI